MAVLKRREAEALILTRILRVANARQRHLHQAHHTGQYFFSRQARSGQIGLDMAANCRERLAEEHEVLELGLVAHCPPLRMVSVLFSAPRVASCGLDMALAMHADPHVLPCRGHRKGSDSAEFIRVFDDGALGSPIDKPGCG